MFEIAFNVLIVFLLTAANGAFSLSEIALISARKARLQQWADDGSRNAKAALELANTPDRFLPTVQIGITLIGILTGAFGGATIAEEVTAYLQQFPLIAPFGGPAGLAFVVIVTTYLTLIVGELAPKRIALHNPERYAATMAGPMRALSVITSPVVRFLNFSTEVVIRLLRVKPSNEPSITEDEIRILINQGAAAGLFEEEEKEMVEGVFRLDDRLAGSLMTPRTETVWLDVGDSPKVILEKVSESGHSRFPVCDGGLDNVLGVVHAKDLLLRCLDGKPMDLKAKVQSPLYVYENLSALRLLKLFKKSKRYTALVVDEYGSVQGVVGMNDVLEAIVGDIPEISEEDADAVQREDGSWLLDGALSIDDFKQIFNKKELLGDGRGYYHTLAGFVIMQLGHIPVTGEFFEWENLRFEVIDMDGRRVDKILATPLDEAGEAD
jgi:putative hemolysin